MMGMHRLQGLDFGVVQGDDILHWSAHSASVGPKHIGTPPAARSYQNPTKLHTKTYVLVLSFDEDGTRTQICFSVAENRRLDFCNRHGHGECTSRSVWCSHAGAPACEITSEH